MSFKKRRGDERDQIKEIKQRKLQKYNRRKEMRQNET